MWNRAIKLLHLLYNVEFIYDDRAKYRRLVRQDVVSGLSKIAPKLSVLQRRQRETDHWLTKRGNNRIITKLTNGEIPKLRNLKGAKIREITDRIVLVIH